MEILDIDEQIVKKKKSSPLIITLSILTIIGSLIQLLYCWFQLYMMQIFTNLQINWPTNIGGEFGNLINAYKYRTIGYYFWIGVDFLCIIAAILFLNKKKMGIYFYVISTVIFILSSVIFFLVFGNTYKVLGMQTNYFQNIFEIISIIIALIFLFLYSLNYKKHCV